MNISNDTKKSFDYLKKSLKMSKRAIEKNQKDDGSTDAEVDNFKKTIDDVLFQINSWETVSIPVTPANNVNPIITSDLT
jgi:hypothetical protein